MDQDRPTPTLDNTCLDQRGRFRRRDGDNIPEDGRDSEDRKEGGLQTYEGAGRNKVRELAGLDD